MDVIFYDGFMRLRSDHGPAHTATARHIAPILLRGAPGDRRLTVRQKVAGWDKRHLAAAVAWVRT